MDYRTRKINIVLLGGRAGVGKTTAANYLYDKLSKFHGLDLSHLAFAAPLKEIATRDFGWDGKKDERGRRLLQVIGTDCGRAYDEDIWVKHMDNTLLSKLPHIAFIDDWRFPNEKSYYKDNFMYDLISVRIERPVSACEGDTSNHASENALPVAQKENLEYNKNTYYNFSIFNVGSLDEFYNKLGSVLDYLETKLVND